METSELHDLNEAVAMELLPAMLFVGILMILGIVGNSVVCFVFCFRRRMTVQHFLIVTLAVFDFLTSLISMPMEIAVLRYFYTYNSVFMCRLLRFLESYTSTASSFLLAVIGLDRFF
jgi:hypothetical protein